MSHTYARTRAHAHECTRMRTHAHAHNGSQPYRSNINHNHERSNEINTHTHTSAYSKNHMRTSIFTRTIPHKLKTSRRAKSFNSTCAHVHANESSSSARKPAHRRKTSKIRTLHQFSLPAFLLPCPRPTCTRHRRHLVQAFRLLRCLKN